MNYWSRPRGGGGICRRWEQKSGGVGAGCRRPSTARTNSPRLYRTDNQPDGQTAMNDSITVTDPIDARLRSGEWVEVRGAEEIARTLDEDGTLDGLPFMAEMLAYCGRRSRVLRPAEKTCVEVASGDYAIREFRGDDVVLLEGLRCSGADHDGCQRACMFFWKMAWLRRAGPDRPTTPAIGGGTG